MTSFSNAGGPAMGPRQWGWQGGCGARSRPLEIAAIVIGFALWWPVGLALLGLRIARRRGYTWNEAIGSARGAFSRFGGPSAGPQQWRPFSTSTGNAAFDDWRNAEMAKLDEERRKLDAAQREFADHLDNLRRARDREEFDGFMAARTKPAGQ